ncbi:MAG: hypothetical protein NVSMB49_12270 [Ktedonobacteraceae bacterium]
MVARVVWSKEADAAIMRMAPYSQSERDLNTTTLSVRSPVCQEQNNTGRLLEHMFEPTLNMSNGNTVLIAFDGRKKTHPNV